MDLTAMSRVDPAPELTASFLTNKKGRAPEYPNLAPIETNIRYLISLANRDLTRQDCRDSKQRE